MLKNKYDVVIIGAGIGGLVCGCYLAKAGMKVLIIEQHTKPGGYCSSFRRKNYVFDTCIHYIKIAPKGNLLNKIFEDLKLKDHLALKKLNISDLIITPYGKFSVYSDVNRTIENIINVFPDEKKNIINFFEFLNTENIFSVHSNTYGKSFGDLMRIYFRNKKIISVFDSLLMNIGLPINKVHALKAYYFFREFFFTQSYYPKGGMQELPNSLNKIFHAYGGTALYGTKVNRIILKDKKAHGVICGETSIKSDFVVSNADSHSTFMELVGKDRLSNILSNRIKKIVPSISAYILYLGLSSKRINRYAIDNSIWYFPRDSFSTIYDNIEKDKPIVSNNYLICSFPSSHDNDLAPQGGTSLSIVFGALFKTKEYWDKNKMKFADNIIKKARAIFPNITDCLEVVSIATPQTLFRYTNNFRGACYGLASTRGQINRSYMPQKTEIENLLMVGHWTTHGIGQGGVSMVAYSGLSAAKRILDIKKTGVAK